MYKSSNFGSKFFLKVFAWGTPMIFSKKNFRQKYANDMSPDSVFDGDHESAIIFMRICTGRIKIVKYERILEHRSKH